MVAVYGNKVKQGKQMIRLLLIAILLNGCAVIPNDYAGGVYAPRSGATSTAKQNLPSSLLTPRGTLLIIPNYSTGSTMAIVKVAQ